MASQGEIILDRPQREGDPLSAEVGDIVFHLDGSCRIGNRVFKHKQAVDYHWNGFHAFRVARSTQLTVWTADGERFAFTSHMSLLGVRWVRWIPLASEVGEPEEDPRPTLGARAILLVDDLWQNLIGLVVWGVIAFVVLCVGISVLRLISAFVKRMFS